MSKTVGLKVVMDVGCGMRAYSLTPEADLLMSKAYTPWYNEKGDKCYPFVGTMYDMTALENLMLGVNQSVQYEREEKDMQDIGQSDDDEVQAMLLALYSLRDNGPQHPTYGVCFNVTELVHPESESACGYTLVSNVAYAAGLHNCTYPVYEIIETMPEQSHLPLQGVHNWDKESRMGLGRYKLVDMCISYLENVGGQYD